ncbi:MAG: hypothetical protein HON94_03010 [Methylococcales bacterium]|jgi:hypothetical protein|nr:hypothetical protein [Methylococcales bacterium]MBT7410450.1 hypothetical protein [Methylococcales bacterium]
MKQLKRIIRDSPINFRIKRFSPEIFSIWKRNINRMDLTETNDKILEDVIDSIVSALSTIKKNKDIKSQSTSISYAFVCGHIQGRLDGIWHNRYIIQKSSTFKELLLLKSMMLGVIDDQAKLLEIQSIYDSLLEENFLDDNPINSENVVYLNKFHANSTQNPDDFKNKLKSFLEETLLLKYDQIIKKNPEIFCPDIQPFFSLEEIIHLIKQL